MRGLEPLLLLFKTPRGGNKPFTGVLLLRVPVRRYVIRTISLDRICLLCLIIRIAVARQRFALLQRWVCVIVISVEAGFGAVLASSLWLLFEGISLLCVLPFIVVVFFWCVHHVYVI